jgi:hypothetical protein
MGPNRSFATLEPRRLVDGWLSGAATAPLVQAVQSQSLWIRGLTESVLQYRLEKMWPGLGQAYYSDSYKTKTEMKAIKAMHIRQKKPQISW